MKLREKIVKEIAKILKVDINKEEEKALENYFEGVINQSNECYQKIKLAFSQRFDDIEFDRVRDKSYYIELMQREFEEKLKDQLFEIFKDEIKYYDKGIYEKTAVLEIIQKV